jgi:FHA domain
MLMFMLRRACMACALLLSGVLLGRPARAQLTAVWLSIDACDDSAYPVVRCALAARDAGGAAVQRLTAEDIQVKLDGVVLRDVAVHTIADPAARVRLHVLVDDGLLNRNRHLAALRSTADAAIDAAEAGDSLMLTFASRAQPLGWPGPRDAGEPVAVARQRLLEHPVQAHAPLFDALCAVLAREAQLAQQAGAAALPLLVLISDGGDRGSAACDARSAPQAVARAQVPVLVLSVGSLAGSLRAIAETSGGQLLDAADAARTRAALTSAVRRQRARHELTFTANASPDGRAHAVKLRLTAGGDRAEAAVTINAAPAAPHIADVRFLVEQTAVQPGALPADGTVRVAPSLVGREVSRVEFAVNGRAVSVSRPPFEFEVDAGQLPPDQLTALTITAYGANQESGAASARTVQLARAGTPAAQRMRTIMGGLRASASDGLSVPMAVAGGAAALLLTAGVLALGQRPRRNLARILGRLTCRDPLPEPAAVPHVNWYDVPTIQRRGQLAVQDGAAGCDQPRTVRLGQRELCLRIHTANAPAREVAIGDAPLLLGRAGAGAAPDVAIDSPFLSAQHARFDCVAGMLSVTDLGSANGTRRNGRPLQAGVRERLSIGDRVLCADVELEVKLASAGGVDGRQ